MPKKPNISDDPSELRRRAEARLRDKRKCQRSKAGGQKSEADTVRILHELEVHQIELEMQNTELQKARNELEAALEKYTNLYDFAPVGYFSIDESGVIVEANLTGASMLGIERSRLVNRSLMLFMSPPSQPIFRAFLNKVFTETNDQTCEATLLKDGGNTFCASFRGASEVCPKAALKCCRITFWDITASKQAEEAQRRLEAIANTNRKLNREIARRKKVEQTLQKSKQHQSRLLKQSCHMQEQLRHLSYQILNTQEEERKRISRELHDEITQILVAINLHLETLSHEASNNPKNLQKKASQTQQQVGKLVNVVHRFARELRPTMLDDLGLIPTLNSFIKEFTKRTGIHVHFKTFTSSKINQLNNATRTVFYRTVQETLTNVTRHTQASLVEISIEQLPNAICLKIKNNGKSFQVQRVMHSKQNTRLGLIGMRERMEMIGGNFSIESAPGKGTTIRAQIPLASHRGGGGGGEIPLMESAKTKP